MKTTITGEKGFLSCLKSVFGNAARCQGISLTHSFHLQKYGAKVPLEYCVAGISLDNGGKNLNPIREIFVGEAHGAEMSAFIRAPKAK